MPRKTAYGTDENCSNRQIDSIPGLTWTFFRQRELFFCVIIKAVGEIGFGASPIFSDNPTDYTDNRKNIRGYAADGIRVFGYTIFVIQELAQKTRAKTIKFESTHPQLGYLYNKMIGNQRLMDTLQVAGWIYQGKIEGQHVFER
ncbi:MAG: hypothetical protein WCY93_12140 [Anaerolineaceae bacterium]